MLEDVLYRYFYQFSDEHREQRRIAKNIIWNKNRDRSDQIKS